MTLAEVFAAGHPRARRAGWPRDRWVAPTSDPAWVVFAVPAPSGPGYSIPARVADLGGADWEACGDG